jgi:hypothetical protein
VHDILILDRHAIPGYALIPESFIPAAVAQILGMIVAGVQ